MNADELVSLEAQEKAAHGDVAFEPNVFLDRIEQLAIDDPRRFDLMSPSLRLSVGFYSAAKRRAAMMSDEENGTKKGSA